MKRQFGYRYTRILTLPTGQIGRSLGPLLFCTLYWWAGRDVAYRVGGVGMLGVSALVFAGLRAPPRSLGAKAT